jgi:hypothetical protein
MDTLDPITASGALFRNDVNKRLAEIRDPHYLVDEFRLAGL